ncbi:MAG: sulfatase/phosphatase domain-containing protein, partial [Litorilinea sp.]
DFVRCEYYDALAEPDNSFGTMYRDGRYKLMVYHGHGLGELYDLENDPHEFENLWDSPDHQTLRAELLLRSFDASMLAMDRGPIRVGPM